MKKLIVIFSVLLISTGILFAQEATPNGSGTIEDPYVVSSLDVLRWLSENIPFWDAHYIQTVDIDASETNPSDPDYNPSGSWSGGAGWSPIGNSTDAFTGSYNGQGHTIEGLYINSPGVHYIGLFGYTSNAVIDSLGLKDIDYTGGSYTGGFVGYCYSSDINECYATGSISAINNSGLLIGWGNSTYADDNTVINNCYTSGSVSGSGDYIGGLIGNTSYKCFVSNTYSTASASTVYTDKGGLIGHNYYSSPYINISTSLWDTETSGLLISEGGTGKTTAEMKTLSTFTNEGWDFMGESANGSGDIWKLDPSVNSGYPFLAWEANTESATPVTLSSFTAQNNNAGIVLAWTTESEVENLGFILERRLKNEIEWENVCNYQSSPALVGHGTCTESHNYQYFDNTVINNMCYEYKLSDISENNVITDLSIIEILTNTTTIEIPGEFGLIKAYPNPFNPSVNISYSLEEEAQVRISIYDIRGNLIETPVNGITSKGKHNILWQPMNIGTGVYFVQLYSNNNYSMHKIVFVK